MRANFIRRMGLAELMNKANEAEQVEIFIDGASQGNPGPSGVGVVISKGGEILKNASKYIGEATNNIAEYSALVFALEVALVMRLNSIRVNTDSELLYRQIKGIYRVKNDRIKPYYEEALRLMKNFSFLEINHVRREFNKEADKLATMAINNANALKKT